ncbi:hypothetical protein Taro_035124 [Colocasia esculenta]|uniref:Uncharacterized protein n=1 Tax=Colocasia esculenta TaxID=4460 RepID=A0A843WDZ4_COLES|nr:hypothetical protein [Colocasia esculenta]
MHRRGWLPIHRKWGSGHRQGLQPHSLHMYIHRHQLHRQELQSHRLYIHNQGPHKQEGYTNLVPYQMPQTSMSMQPSLLGLLGVHLQLLQDQMNQLMNPTPSEESDATANPPVLTPEEAFRQVFGRDRPGRIRCGGRGQTLRSWYGPSECGSSSNTVYQRLLEEQSQQKSEICQQKSEISQQKSEIERMKKNH